MGIGLAHDFTTFLLFRVAIGVIGASFVITQYHTTQMFAPRCVGTANATTAGWGNFGGGVSHLIMPLVFAFFATTLGWTSAVSWRAAMFVAGAVCMLAGVAYYFLTQDTPAGNFRELRSSGRMPARQEVRGSFLAACRDRRVWALFVVYGLCFGIELTIDNIAAIYFLDYFSELKQMDTLGALSHCRAVRQRLWRMSFFARPLGGIVADRCGQHWGLPGRVKWLFLVLFCEGLLLMLFSQMRGLYTAIPVLMICGLFVHMGAGATYAVVPFVNRRALGSVAGIVGAGGNAGAVLSGFLFKMRGPPLAGSTVRAWRRGHAGLVRQPGRERERHGGVRRRPAGGDRGARPRDGGGGRLMLTSNGATNPLCVFAIDRPCCASNRRRHRQRHGRAALLRKAGRVRHARRSFASSRSAKSRGPPTTASA